MQIITKVFMMGKKNPSKSTVGFNDTGICKYAELMMMYTSQQWNNVLYKTSSNGDVYII